MSKKNEKETKLLEELGQLIYYQMKEKGQGLQTAGKLFSAATAEIDGKKCGMEVVESTILKACVGCKGRESCRFSLEDKDRLGRIMERRGGITVGDFKQCHPCRKSSQFVEEANAIYERELFKQSMEEQMTQMQVTIGKQYERAGELLEELGKNIKTSNVKKSVRETIEKALAKLHIQVGGIYVHTGNQGKEIYLYARKKKSKQTTIKEVADLLSNLLNEKMKPIDGQKKFMNQDFGLIGFCCDEKFHTLHGIVSESYEKNGENGDSVSVGAIGSGTTVSMISDGMGTGTNAKKESKQIIETMEELLEAGVSKSQAIKMLRAMATWRPGKETYATLDFLQIDLYAGIGTFFKLGACPCLLKRRGTVKVLEMESILPGKVSQGTLPFHRKKLESEDMILQFSDGILDCLPGEGLETIKAYMEEIQTIRPQGFVEELFQKIKETKGYEKKDDMTMIALGIWGK